MNKLDYQIIKKFNTFLSKRKSFGLFIALGDKRLPYIKQITTDYFDNDCGCQEGEIVGDAFTGYICKGCGKAGNHPNTGVPLYCDECSKKLNKCAYCGEYLERIGHFPNHMDIFTLLNKNPEVKTELLDDKIIFTSKNNDFLEINLKIQPIEYDEKNKKNLLNFANKYL